MSFACQICQSSMARPSRQTKTEPNVNLFQLCPRWLHGKRRARQVHSSKSNIKKNAQAARQTRISIFRRGYENGTRNISLSTQWAVKQFDVSALDIYSYVNGDKERLTAYEWECWIRYKIISLFDRRFYSGNIFEAVTRHACMCATAGL